MTRFLLNFRKTFCEPYTADGKVIDAMMSRAKYAVEAYENWGHSEADLEKEIFPILYAVLWANEDLLEEAGMPPPEHPEWKGDEYSPAIDFSDPEGELCSGERLVYHLQLETRVWKEISGLASEEQSDDALVTSLPVWYDIWLQTLLLSSDPARMCERLHFILP